MLKNLFKRFMSLTLAVIMVFSLVPAGVLTAHAASLSVEGLTTSTSGSASWDLDGTTITGTVSGKNGFISAFNSTQNGTITLANERGDSATGTLSFSYQITENTGSVTIAGQTVSGGGTFSKSLEFGDTVAIKITSGKGTSNQTAITITNVALTVVADSVTATFKAPENGTYTVNGTAIAEDTSYDVKPPVTYELAAVPANGYKLVGWYSTAANHYISHEQTASVQVLENTEIYPVFMSEETPVFKVGESIYTNLNEANEAAKGGSTIILIHSGTLPAGTYEISSGVKLLIPYNASYTADFDTEPGLVNARKSGVYAKPTVHKTLTLADGAVLNCYGQINVNAQMYVETNIYTSQVTGPYGAIDLASGSKLNLESGSVLYCYGYIGGEGTVESHSGSKVYQMMQINDWRGGTATSTLKDKLEGNSFLFSQYYFQNVEAKLKMNYGSTMYAVTGLVATLSSLAVYEQILSAPVIGSTEGLFRLTGSGDYMTLKYDAATDRVKVDLHGKVVTKEISLKIDLSVLSGTLNTSDYIMPLPMNYDIHIHSGSTVTFAEQLKLMPGTSVLVDSGATVTVSDGGAIYLYDADDWNSGKFTHQKTIYPLRYVHATKGAPAVTRTSDTDAALEVNGTLTANGPVYSTAYTENGGDAGITGTGTVYFKEHGTVHLKEVNNNNTDDIITVTCVPVLGDLAGHDGLTSYDLGSYKSADGTWYQYTLTGEGFEVLSGAEEVDGKFYVASAKDLPAKVLILAEKDCLSVTNADRTLYQSAARLVGDTYQLENFKGNAVVTAKDTHTEELIPAVSPTCIATGLGEGLVCADCGHIIKEQPVMGKVDHTRVETVVAPTCTEQGFTLVTCAVEGCDFSDRINYVDPVAHKIADGDEGTVTKAATCTEPGELTFYCKDCGAVAKTEIIEATGHSYGEWEVVTAPACTEEGQQQKTCSACGDVVTETIAALGHSLNEGEVEKAPTCAEVGTTKYSCTREGCDYTESHDDIPATGNHDWQFTEVVTNATCTESGSELYTCSVCQKVETRVLDAAGHTEVTDEAVDATCTETGLTEGSHCEVCGDVFVSQQVTEALGHEYESVVTDPTCTDQGFTTHTCIRGDHSYVDSYTEPVGSAHEFTVVAVAPTCTNPGYNQNVCNHCGYTEKLEGTEVDALGHSYTAAVTAPTCTDQGFTTYTCERCGSSYVDDYVKANGHTYTDTVTDPTCEEEGFTTHTCTVCEFVMVDTYVDPLGHTTEDHITDATCTEEGKLQKICSVCEKIVSEEPIAALGHAHTVEISVEKAASCEEVGSRTMQCERCDDQISEVIPALGHDYHDEVIQQPTCTVHGIMVTTCANCGDSREGTVAALGHKPAVTTPAKAPTCTEAGHEDEFTCANCGEVTGGEVIPALGHDFDVENGVEIVPATCYLEGQIEVVCRRCSEVDAIASEKLPHTSQIIPGTPATCTEDGLTDGAVCAVKGCRTNLISQKVIPALGHSYAADPGKEPTCTEPGQASGQKCQTCGAWEGEIVEIPALGHTCDETTWTISKAASCMEEGEEINTCSVCGETVTRVIPRADHVEEIIPGKAATYDQTGMTSGKKCMVCKAITEEQQVISKLVVDWEAFITGLEHLEYYANEYAKNNPGKDPTKLMINYIRTGIERYNDEEWQTMAGAAETVFINEVRAYDTIYGTHAHALRCIDQKSLTLPNGSKMVFDHMFGALNVSSKNNYVQNQNDFGSWVGDICDLMMVADAKGVAFTGDMDKMIEDVAYWFGRGSGSTAVSAFNMDDVYADLDAFYVVSRISAGETSLFKIFSEYYGSTEPTDASRAAYFLNNRFPGKMTQEEIREAIYSTYKNHLLAQLLESGRELSNKPELQQAACYAFADYLYEESKGLLVAPEQPGEDEDEKENAIYTQFSSKQSTLAPGITQTVNYANDANGKQMVYYVATVDISRSDVSVHANYKDHDPSIWGMAPVSAQMTAAQAMHTDPQDEANYIPNYNAILGVNANFYNMATGEPSSLLVMHGKTYKENTGYFFAILDDGTPIIGGTSEYAQYKDRIVEAVGGSTQLIHEGKPAYSADTNKAPRTVVGITADNKVVMLVVDGRQEPISAGATYQELGQMMIDAGCVSAINLDGGGSTTYVAKQEGEDHFAVLNRPSDSVERSVSASLLVVSTAETSQEFHHAMVETETDYMTVGSTQEITLTGVGAAGNKAEIPEGAVLTVSDEAVASVEGNVITSLSRGPVTVNLMLDGNVVGSKTLYVIGQPDGLKFEDASLNVIYGQAVQLPLQAFYQNNFVTINSDDIVWALSNAAAGKMEGFAFIGDEASGVRNVMVTAKVKANNDVAASMSLRLYGADESIFDFGNVTAGNESLAWNRVVTNTMTPDGKNYYATGTGDDIEAQYTFALDMKAIKAPARLQPLMEYLGGFAESVGDNASPWDYMLALGGRVSSLTNVTITAKFPAGVEVNYDDLTFVNDFMNLNSIDFDEATRTLTMRCDWVRQTAGIDPSTANSQGILSGMKLTFTDPTQARSEVVVEGDVTYDIYLDTSQLHSFAKDPANQEAYGIYDYINPDDPEDAGGHFKDTYITFVDSFNVIREKLNGWVTLGDDGLRYYYVNNEKVTGVYAAPDLDNAANTLYYEFAEDGLCLGTYTGLFKDQTVQKYRYAKMGVLNSGWVMVGQDWHYFGTSDKNAYVGNRKLSGIYFDFDETGRVTSGVWAKDMKGTRYYYGPSYYQKGWYTIDGVEYCFDKGYMLTGITSIRTDKTQPYRYYDFGPNGAPAVLLDGIHTIEGSLRYLEDGVLTEKGLFKHTDGNYYFSGYKGILRVNGEYGTYSVDGCDIPNGKYMFDAEGRMVVNAIVERDGKLYYYEQGKPKEKGLFKFGDDYYFAVYKGEVKTNGEYKTYTVDGCDMRNDKYLFGADGKMVLNAIVEKDGKLYYYENGKPTEKGLFQYEGDYYFAVYGGLLKTNGIYGTYKLGECDLPNSQYEFGADGKMLQGIVEKDGKLYYYENGKPTEKGLFKFGDDYYFSVYKGQLKTNGIYGTYKLGECDLPNGQYEFGADGKMTKGIVEKDGKLYYYENGKGVEKGLFQYNGGYYFSVYKGELRTNGVYGVYILEDCGLPKGNYEFGPDGRMYDGIVEKDGKLYYYENGKGVEKGLFQYEDSYYFAGYKGELRVNGEYSAYKTSCDLPKGTYTFDAEGKLLQGFIEKDGKKYYYENGKRTEKGLFEYNGDYYYVTYGGVVQTNGTYKTYQVKPCGIPNGTYEFDAEGKLMQGIVEKNGKLYFYENGRGAEKGLFFYEGHYYFSVYKGELVVNRVFKVYNGNGLLIEQNYTFNEKGQIIA